MPEARPTRIRFLILAALFAISSFSYGDRVVLSITSIAFTRDLHLNAIQLGYLLSGFSWAYVVAQLPSGYMLDRFGTKRVYGTAIVLWSILAAAVGFAGYLHGTVTANLGTAFLAIFGLRLLSGLVQAPVFPGNGRVVAAWFPSTERGMASAIFNSSQYFSVVLFGPLMGWVASAYGWKQCFWLLGLIGLALAAFWFRIIHDVKTHPAVNAAEIATIEGGGGLCVIGTQSAGPKLTWDIVFRLFGTRMLFGIYLGQYCIVTLTWFFLSWFPVYLHQVLHMSLPKAGLASALPAFCGFAGGVLGGITSDRLLAAGKSVTLARKLPIVLGMTLAMSIMLCNLVTSTTVVIVLMSLAFFGKGFGALGWTVISDTSPKGMVGLNGGLFNLCGNIAGITTPIFIGYLVQRTGNFRIALMFVGITALMAIISYVFITGPIRRLTPEDLGHGIPAQSSTS
jgi:ACS family glucarate transporter-like MFS transporter